MSTNHDYGRLLWDEVGAIGEFLHEIDDADFDEQSLCGDWRVRDVVGHMELGHTTPMLSIMKGMVAYRFNIDRGSSELSRQWGEEHTPDELRDIWDRELVGRHRMIGIARTIRKIEGCLDHAIHHQDMRRPLGRPRQIPEGRLVALLEAVPKVHTPFFSTRGKVKGLRLEATDAEFVCGDGPLVRGPGEAIMLAAAGRGVALADLEGDGVAVLAERTGAALPDAEPSA
jgi:uncharacterized protein (TIGR03083 family)